MTDEFEEGWSCRRLAMWFLELARKCFFHSNKNENRTKEIIPINRYLTNFQARRIFFILLFACCLTISNCLYDNRLQQSYWIPARLLLSPPQPKAGIALPKEEKYVISPLQYLDKQNNKTYTKNYYRIMYGNDINQRTSIFLTLSNSSKHAFGIVEKISNPDSNEEIVFTEKPRDISGDEEGNLYLTFCESNQIVFLRRKDTPVPLRNQTSQLSADIQIFSIETLIYQSILTDPLTGSQDPEAINCPWEISVLSSSIIYVRECIVPAVFSYLKLTMKDHLIVNTSIESITGYFPLEESESCSEYQKKQRSQRRRLRHRNDENTLMFPSTIDLGTIGNYGLGVYEGVSLQDYMGTSVAGLGDVNGDGWNDFIVTSQFFDSSGQPGRAYIVYGSSALRQITITNVLTASYVTIITGEQSAGIQGVFASSAGDFNADGYQDVLIGTPYFNGGKGKAYVIYGKSSMPSTIDLGSLGTDGVSIFANQSNNGGWIGRGVACAGDMNKDGYSDVIIGVPKNSNGGSAAGRAYVIFGGAAIPSIISLANPLTANQGITITGEVSSSAGWAVSSVDINNDGNMDLIIGANQYSTYKGRVYVVYGGSLGSSVSLGSLGSGGITITGEANGNQCGYAVANAGDINKDGFSDILIGAYVYSSNTGRVYLIYGGTSLGSTISLSTLGTKGVVITGETSSYAGFSVTGLGDINFDGYEDFAIGAYMYGVSPSYNGRVYIINGAASLSSSISLASLGSLGSTITGKLYDQAGYAVANAGDIDNDGFNDLLIGAIYSRNPSGGGIGKAYVVYAQPTTRPTGQPSSQPSGQPSRQPTSQPTKQPFNRPTGQPSRQPTAQPTRQPYSKPTGQPSRQPTSQPTRQPVSYPSACPTQLPVVLATPAPTTETPTFVPSTSRPSSQPTCQPTNLPTSLPTDFPTSFPTSYPTAQPSGLPTNLPSSQPSNQPTGNPSSFPTIDPTSFPSSQPSGYPSCQPSGLPSTQPSSSPTASPSTSLPSSQPSLQPTVFPSSNPSSYPTAQPTTQPTARPSGFPTLVPTTQPTGTPSSFPSNFPSCFPSSSPTCQPSTSPTAFPTCYPSSVPSQFPSSFPTSQPTTSPSSSYPTSQPTHCPSNQPSSAPSTRPSGLPSASPSDLPTSVPTISPTSQPTIIPSTQPSAAPFANPTSQPSCQPSSHPSTIPNSKPSSKPSCLPTVDPTTRPTMQPSSQPSCQPTSKPSSQPSVQPSSSPTQSKSPTPVPSIKPSTIPTVTPSAAKVISLQISSLTVFEGSFSDNEIQIGFADAGIRFGIPLEMTLSLNLLSPVSVSLITAKLIPNKFLLSGNSSLPLQLTSSLLAGSAAVYEVSMSINSSAFQMIYSNNQQIEVLSQTIEPPKPKLHRAEFSSDGSNIKLYFDSSTNKNENSFSSFPCYTLFLFVGVNDSSCYWVDDKTISITQFTFANASNLLNVGDNITMIPASSRLKAACPRDCSSWQSVSSQSIVISPPSDLTPPVVQISAPSLISPCQPLRLDLTSSTGNGGREWSNVSVVSSQIPPVSDLRHLNDFMKNNFTISPPVDIPNYFFKNGTSYRFEVILCNFLNACGKAVLFVNVSRNENDLIPSVAIAGMQSLSLYTRFSYTLKGLTFTTNCVGVVSYQSLSYIWSVTSLTNNELPKEFRSFLAKSNSPVVTIPAYSFLPGGSYSVQLTVTSLLSLRTSSSSPIKISIPRGNLIPVIYGGKNQVIRFSELTTIDGSLSYDEDLDPTLMTGTKAGLFYRWTCFVVMSNSNCSRYLSLPNDFTSERLKFIPSNLLSINTSFTLLMQINDKIGRMASTTVTFTVTTSKLNDLSILTPQSSVTLLPPSSTLTILASMDIYRPCLGTWSTTPMIPLTSITSTPFLLSFALGNQQSFNLKLLPNVLPERATISFTLKCGLSMTSIEVTTNGSPVPGQMILNPVIGYELLNEFTFIARYWSDPDLPLTYQFGFISPTIEANLITLLRSSLTSVTTTLPAGYSGNNHRINCTLQVFDVYNSSKTLYQLTTVLPLTVENKFSAVSSYIDERSTGFTVGSIDDQRAFISVASSVLNYINCSVSMNCSSLHRFDCRLTPNTCGRCLSGYHGDTSDRNTPCVPNSFYENASSSSLSAGCHADIDCNVKVQRCINHTCTFLPKQCPLDCSFHGECKYRYIPTGLPLPSCSIADLTCEAVCSCDTGFTGLDCSVNKTALPRIQAITSILIDSLKNLTIIDEQTPQSVQSWANSLNSIVTNPVYVASQDIPTVQRIALKTVIVGNSLNVSAYALLGILSVMDNIASLSAMNGALSNLTAIPETPGILEVLSSYCSLVSKGTIYGESPSTFLYNNFRMINSINLVKGSSYDVTVPSTEIESILNITKSSLKFLAPSNNLNNTMSGQSQAVALIETHEKSYTAIPNTFYSDPLQLIVIGASRNASSSSSSLQKIRYKIRHNEAFYRFVIGNETKEMFTSRCKYNIANITSFHCKYSEKVLVHNCNGSFAGRLVSYCPEIAPNCNVLNITTSLLISNQSRVCEVTSFTAAETVCTCLFQPSHSPGGQRRRLAIAENEKDYMVSGQTLVAATEYIGNDFTATFSAQDDLNGRDGAAQAAIMIGIVCSVWMGGFLIFFFVGFATRFRGQSSKDKEKYKNKQTEYQKNEASDLSSQELIQKMKEEIFLYIELLIPAVYNSKQAFLQRCWTELTLHHRYFRLVTFDSHRSSWLDRFHLTIKVLSIQTLQMFVQAVLFDLQNPENDGSCSSHYSESDCLARKTVLDQSQSYCRWSLLDHPHCSYDPPRFSQSAVMIVMIFTALCSAMVKLPLDYCLKVWIAPVYEKEDFQQEKVTNIPSSPSRSSRVLPLGTINNLHSIKKPLPKEKEIIPFLGIKQFLFYPFFLIGGFVFPSLFPRWKARKTRGRNVPQQLIDSHRSIYTQLNKSNDLFQIIYQANQQFNRDILQKSVENKNMTRMKPIDEKEMIAEINDDLLEQGVFTQSYQQKMKKKKAKMKPTTKKEIIELIPEQKFVKELCEQILHFRIALKKTIVQQEIGQDIAVKEDGYYSKPIELILSEDKRWQSFNDQWGVIGNIGPLVKRMLNDEDDDEEEKDEDDEDFEEVDDDELLQLVNFSIESQDSLFIFQFFESTAIEEYLRLAQEYIQHYHKSQLKFQQLSKLNISIELMYLFLVDLLGRHTPAAKIFHNKFNEDYPIVPIVTRCFKLLIILFIFLLNGFFIYFLLLKSVSKGWSWQWQFLRVNLLTILIEIFIYETIECLFLNYFIPESVHREVFNAMDSLILISDNLEHFFLQQKLQLAMKLHPNLDRKLDPSIASSSSKDEFDASNYLFLSKSLVSTQPELIESFIIHSYQNHYPGSISSSWKHYQKRLRAHRFRIKDRNVHQKQLKKLLLPQDPVAGARQSQLSIVSRQSRAARYRASSSSPAYQPPKNKSRSFSQQIEWFGTASFLFISSIIAAFLYSFQVIGLLPMFSQRIIIRFLQTTVLSGLTLLYFLPGSQQFPYYLWIAVGTVGLLLLIFFVRFLLRQRDKTRLHHHRHHHHRQRRRGQTSLENQLDLLHNKREEKEQEELRKKTAIHNDQTNSVLLQRIDALKERFSMIEDDSSLSSSSSSSPSEGDKENDGDDDNDEDDDEGEESIAPHQLIATIPDDQHSPSSSSDGNCSEGSEESNLAEESEEKEVESPMDDHPKKPGKSRSSKFQTCNPPANGGGKYKEPDNEEISVAGTILTTQVMDSIDAGDPSLLFSMLQDRRPNQSLPTHHQQADHLENRSVVSGQSTIKTRDTLRTNRTASRPMQTSPQPLQASNNNRKKTQNSANRPRSLPADGPDDSRSVVSQASSFSHFTHRTQDTLASHFHQSVQRHQSTSSTAQPNRARIIHQKLTSLFPDNEDD